MGRLAGCQGPSVGSLQEFEHVTISALENVQGCPVSTAAGWIAAQG